jgi:C4-dicarboxylate transporter, DctM subunit
MAAIPFLIMVVTLLLGVPIAFSLAAAGIVGIYLLTGDWNVVLRVIGTTPFSTVADYVLTTIPMFILMAYFAAAGGLARDLYTAGAHWLSRVRGGLAIATVFACGIFGAMSGASLAAASVMSTIAMPEMRRHGYSDELAAGSIGVGSTLDILIPPSVGMVIYGIMTQTSIGKLLIAGIVPGLIVGAFLILAIVVWVRVSPSHAPETYTVPIAERWRSLGRIWASLLLIVLVVALLYLGVATPTEVGALGAFLSGVIGVVTGRLTLAGALDAIRQTIKTSAMIFMILIGATIFGYYMAMSQIPQHVVAAVTELNLNRWVVICGIVVAYFVVSMFMDELPLLLLTLQLTFPLIVSMGFDPVWFGVLSMLMVSMGLVFPPVGMIAFVVSATAGVSLVKVYKGTSILMIALVLTTALIMVFPQIVLWLPNTMR